MMDRAPRPALPQGRAHGRRGEGDAKPRFGRWWGGVQLRRLWGDNVPGAPRTCEGGGAERWVRRQFSSLLLIMCLPRCARRAAASAAVCCERRH